MRVALVGLYSSMYPALGETHALSVLAAIAIRETGSEPAILDMVALSEGTVEPLLTFLDDARPEFLGISVPYGTFSFIVREYVRIRERVGEKCWIVLGGAIPTALATELLSLLPNVLVVVGEGEVAFAVLLRQRRVGHMDLSLVPGLAHGGALGHNTQALTDLASLPPPCRSHIAQIATNGGQIYTEASRGCSWSACRFCLRGLTDVRGSPQEYRRVSPARLSTDIETLFRLGIREVSFADEDFLGGNLVHAQRLTETVWYATHRFSGKMAFNASITPQSIFSCRMSATEQAERRQLLVRLREAGLRKAFLGIESGSSGQLARYLKGHSKSEAVEAVRTLREIGIEVEAGWVMFDPLCSVAELEENVLFLRQEALVDCVSYLFAELRLQVGTRYVAYLERAEKELGRQLYSRRFDPDTLSYEYRFVDSDVDHIVTQVRNWTCQLRPLHYPLKYLTRFDGVAGATWSQKGRIILHDLRQAVFHAFSLFLAEGGNRSDAARVAWEEVNAAGVSASRSLMELLGGVDSELAAQPVIAGLMQTAREWCLGAKCP